MNFPISIVGQEKIWNVMKYRHFWREWVDTLIRLNPKTNAGKLENSVLLTYFAYFQDGRQKW